MTPEEIKRIAKSKPDRKGLNTEDVQAIYEAANRDSLQMIVYAYALGAVCASGYQVHSHQ